MKKFFAFLTAAFLWPSLVFGQAAPTEPFATFVAAVPNVTSPLSSDLFYLDRSGVSKNITFGALAGAISGGNSSIYGPAIIQSGLVPTWPTASLASCYVISGGSSYTSNPTVTPLAGVTNGGSGGGTATATETSGAVASCTASGGTYSFPPTAYVTGGGGSGAALIFSLNSTQSLTTSAGVLLYNGASIAVPAYTNSYAATSGTEQSFCDFINTSTGAWTTQLAAAGNSYCATPPSGNILLRIVNSGNGQYEDFACTPSNSFCGGSGDTLGVINGIVAIQYYVGQMAQFAYYATNTRDFPPVSTSLLNGGTGQSNVLNPNSAVFNGACMQGAWNTRQGQCQLSGNYFVLLSSDQEPVAFSNTLDAGPVLVLTRGVGAGVQTNTRAGVTGDLLGYITSEGATASNGVGTPAYTQYTYFLTRVTNASTPAGEEHFGTVNRDGFLSRFVIGLGLYATPSVNGINAPGQCGQYPAPTGYVALTDMGPSTINLCGNAGSNLSGNPTGYYLDNRIMLQDGLLKLYGSSSGVTSLVPQSTASGTATLPANSGTLAETNLTQAWAVAQQFTGTGAPSLTTGVTITGELSGLLSSFTTGEGAIYSGSVYGLVAQGEGSSYDFTLLNNRGGGVCALPTGTTTFQCFNTIEVGTPGATLGVLSFTNATSGTIAVEAPTGALGTQTLTLPDATGTFLTTAGAIMQVAPTNPAGTTSTSGVMAGLGGQCHLTPLYSSRVEVVFWGAINSNTAGDGAEASIYYGTGTAPSNGASKVGTNIGANVSLVDTPAAGFYAPFQDTVLISGLTPGTAYWFDLVEQAVTGGTASVANLNCMAHEI